MSHHTFARQKRLQGAGADAKHGKGDRDVKFLIQTLDGETIDAELSDVGGHYPDDDILYVGGVPCVLSTARSLEAEAMKEAVAIIRGSLICLDDEQLDDARAWLKKWGSS